MKKGLLVLLLLAATNVFAADGMKKFSIGGEAGYQMDDNSKRFMYGADLALMLGNHFSIGAFYLHTKLQSISFGIGSASAVMDYYGGELALVPVRFLRIGGRVGQTTIKAETSVRTAAGVAASQASSSYLFFGPVVGIDIPLGNTVSFGPQGTWVLISTSGKYLNVFHAVGTLKLHF